MSEFWATFAAELSERFDGPMWMRLAIQPTVASVLAIRSGLRDAREGRVPYFWSLLSEPAHRREMLRDGWKSVSKVFLLVIVLDIVYQYISGGPILLRQSLILAILLAIIPYLALRGVTTRLARRVGKAR